MPVRQTSVGVGSIAGSSTFFPLVPVEQGRARGVATLSIITNGTSGASTTSNALTTCERGVLSSGLTVNLTASGGVVTAAVPNAAGLNYQIGQLIHVIGGGATAQIVLRVDEVGATGNVIALSVLSNGSSGATNQTGLATAVEPASGPNGLQVNVTAAGGVVTVVAPGAGARRGSGYRIGDIVTILGTGASAAVTAQVTALTG
jgi:hypothetical protein